MSEEKQFVDGLIIKHPGDNAPDFVKAKLSFKLDEFKDWVSKCVKEDPTLEWLNVEIKESRGGKLYAERNTWKPQESAPAASTADVPW